jgi:hypothetical protein
MAAAVSTARSCPLGMFFAWRPLKPYARQIEAAEARGD